LNITPISFDTNRGNYEKKLSLSKEKYKISLPDNWWTSINTYDIIDTKPSSLILFIDNIKKRKQEKSSYFQHKWSAANGDYRVRTPHEKDMAYYRELKQKFMKYSVYPVIAISGLIIYLFSMLIAQIKL
jgi:hypothetical protein